MHISHIFISPHEPKRHKHFSLQEIKGGKMNPNESRAFLSSASRKATEQVLEKLSHNRGSLIISFLSFGVIFHWTMMEKGYVQLEGHVKVWCFGWDWHLFWKATWQNFERLDVGKGGMVSTLDRTAGGEWLLLWLHTTLIMNDHANAQQFAYNLPYHLDSPRIMHHVHCWCTIYFILMPA